MAQLLAICDHTVLPGTRRKWTHPALTPAMQAGTRFTYPGGIEGWVDLCLIAPRPGVEPATFRSRVQRSTNATTKTTVHIIISGEARETSFLYHRISIWSGASMLSFCMTVCRPLTARIEDCTYFSYFLFNNNNNDGGDSLLAADRRACGSSRLAWSKRSVVTWRRAEFSAWTEWTLAMVTAL